MKMVAGLKLWGRKPTHTPMSAATMDRYLKPVREELIATATFTDDSDIAACTEQLKAKGKAKLWLQAKVVLQDGTVAATLSGKYAAFVRQ